MGFVKRLSPELWLPEGVTLVRDEKAARRALAVLRQHRDIPHVWDTETTGVDPKTESPHGKGRVICLSAYLGPNIDFGNGPKLWIDNLGDAEGLIEIFREYFEDPEYLKVWHNYSFDRAVIHNHGIDVRGFGGDTMQMARLWDPGRMNYSLESLTEDLLDRRKAPMKEVFGKPKLKKDGTPGKDILVPSTLELQTNPKHFGKWVDYSTYDTEGTWRLMKALKKRLGAMPWRKGTTLWDFYLAEWLPLGELLTDEERRGVRTDTDYFAEIQPRVESDRNKHEAIFKAWATRYNKQAQFMNTGSDAQVQTMLFGGAPNEKTAEKIAKTREFEVENTTGYIEPGKKKAKKKRKITLKVVPFELEPIEYTDSGWPSVNGDSLRALAGDFSHPTKVTFGKAYEAFGGEDNHEEAEAACRAIWSLYRVGKIDTLLSNFIVPLQTLPCRRGRIHPSLGLNTATGRLSSKKPNLQNQPNADNDEYAIRDAYTIGTLSDWLEVIPRADRANVEANIQQALIPDRIYERGYEDQVWDELLDGLPMCLLVADYSQLELRVLAHLAACKSMINAFNAGGDFHSRTAATMFPEVRKAVERGDVLIDWDKEKNGPPPAPMLKEVFGFERGRAKTINFSVAYGKTARGFALDWGTTEKEANRYIDMWYDDRPEVKAWQARTIAEAYDTGVVKTILGRPRAVPELQARSRSLRNRGERICKNSPIQGGAADIVNRAMLLCDRDPWLRSHGVFQVLQVHDELIFEGPRLFMAEAQKRVEQIMSHPFTKDLRLPLPVSSHYDTTWLLAK